MARTESRALLLAGLLALSGCATTGTPTAPTAQTPATKAARVLGLYELSVNGLSGPSAQATIRPATGLSAQAAEVTGGLSFTRTNMSNLVDETNHVVHMTATFTVTNTTQTPIALPTYIPVDTAGTGGTSGSTPFGEVRTRTGAPVSATGMQVEVSHQSSGGVIQPDPSATPLRDGLDTGGLQVTAPAGQSVAGLSHQGWEGGALAPGASQTITFAARVPLKGAQISDADPFIFKLMFAVADTPGRVALTNVASVQGSTPAGDAATPLSGQSVTVEGIVTAAFNASLQGFFVQEEGIDADSDATTSDGVFVYCGTSCPTVNVGDRVRVTGTATEFNTSTQITATASSVTTLASGVALPDVQSLTLPLNFTARERSEGMRVSVSGKVTNTFPLGRFGSFDIADDRVMNFTQLNAPDVAANAAYQADFKNRFIRIDDGNRQQNPDPEIFARGGQNLSAANTLRGGDSVQATGVLTWSNDSSTLTSGGSLYTYRVLAAQSDVQITDSNPRLNAPEAVGGNLRVGAMNVLNYFTALVTTNTGCTPNGVGGSAARGANDCGEFLRQQDKIVAAISGMNPDVLNLMEIQNDFDKGSSSSVAWLVNALNSKLGAGTYAYVNPGAKVGTDAISVAMIYKPGAVTPVGNLALLNNTFDATYTDTCNRPTWAQTFQSNANGGRFTAVAMHLKSKGSACADTSDADTGDGQGNGYIARRNAARAIVAWLNTNPTGVTEDDRILMGDYNAYAAEEPLTILGGGGYANLFGQNVYSYQFDGQWGSLDHATGSASLAAQVTGKTKWHINSDEPAVLDYNTEYKSAAQQTSFYAADAFRSSDHDPLLIGLNLTAQPPITPPAQTSSVSLSAATASVSVPAGQSTTNTVNVTRSNFTGSVSLATSVSGSGTAPNVTVTTQPGTGNSGALNIDATGATAGTYTVTVTGSGTGISSATTTFTVTVGAVSSAQAGLIFSEYVEGTSNNKAIEIYNGTGQTVAANRVSVKLYSNGGTTAGSTYTIPSALAPGQTFVITNSSANATLAAKSNATSAVTAFNGDDALELLLDGAVVDTFGQVGFDPGTAWTGGSVSTLDKTLRRKASVTTGDINGADAFDPSVEWDVFNVDTFDGLGTR
ncbi:ExeM/NucH family extracellular endonuclease [Deinococcus sp.]|uniref:ExeM/NucH family extracellular endonuclease n=1 Tax=Deinococcus sp. TaxID=47478 RepID=UPI0025BFAEFB|nr:ExeM/NucH family extracellular endonuclease [Deinococcus sp.]